MTSIFRLAAVALVIGAVAASAADAQTAGRHRRGNSITLYSAPNFRGNSVTLRGPAPNLDDFDFNDRAQSARVNGAWLLCAAKMFKNDCVTLTHDVRYLKSYNMNRRATSARPR